LHGQSSNKGTASREASSKKSRTSRSKSTAKKSAKKENETSAIKGQDAKELMDVMEDFKETEGVVMEFARWGLKVPETN